MDHSEATKAGVERARLLGKKLGRPRVSLDREDEIEALLKLGWPATRVRKELHVGTDVVARVSRRLREHDGQSLQPAADHTDVQDVAP